MIDAASLDAAVPPAGNSQLSALRKKIGWICQALRLLIVGYVLWILWIVVHYWGDREWVTATSLHTFAVDVSGASQTQFAIAFAVNLLLWGLLVATCFCLWRVLGLYLEGRIFTVEAALWLRRFGILGLVAATADIVSRSLIIMALTAHLPSTAEMHHGLITSADPLHFIFALIVIAFAHIFKTAAEIAGEHAQFV